MRETLFILFVALVLLALTAVRYRKQIVGMIRVYRSLTAVRSGNIVGAAHQVEQDRGTLVRCAECGTWIPERKAKKGSKTEFVCSGGCRAGVRPL